MNNKILLSRKRNKNESKTQSSPHQSLYSNSPMVQFNGFNIMELHYTEYLENKNESNINGLPENNIIDLKESNHNIHEINENNGEIIEMTRTKAKNIEEYYSTKFGVSTIKENCFKCLMTNFLSNELLYFNSRKDLFNYIKYCFVTKNKILFIDEDIYKENKDNFFNANSSFINGWRFFIPKTICKGCFMDIINMKHLISNIKNIFSDIERDSLCRTNYRNYALFSPRFRAAFSLRSRSKHPRRPNRIISNNKNRINSQNHSSKNTLKHKDKIYNLDIKYDKSKNILIIDKKNLDNSIIDIIKNSANNNILSDIEFNKNNNNNILDGNKSNLNKGENNNSLNNLSFKGKNNINIINNININNNYNEKTNLNFDIINNKIKELLKDINICFKYFFSNLDIIKKKIEIINNFTNYFKHKLYQLFLYPSLFQFSQQNLQYIRALYSSFNDDRKNLNIYLINAKNSSDNALNYLNNISNEIKKKSIVMNLKEKNNLISVIKDLHFLIEENKKTLEKYNNQFDNFNVNYIFLFNLVSNIMHC